MATGLVTWSTTAATNASADSNVNWAEGQAPASVNDSARAMMASVAKWRDDTNGSIATGGTSTAFTVTSNQSFASLTAMDNAVVAFIPHTTSGAAPTLAVDGLTAKKIRMVTGIDLTDGVLVAGSTYVVTYEAGVGEFLLHNFAGNPWLIPLGCCLPFFGTTSPNASLVLPYGQAISRTTYSTLFTMFGTTFGAGDGSTTFNIPDLRSRVVAGKSDMGGSDNGLLPSSGAVTGTTLGYTGGTHTVTIAQANLPSVNFSHSLTGLSVTSDIVRTSTGFTANINNPGGAYTAFDGTPTTSAITSPVTGTVSSGGSGTAANNVQPTIVGNYLMRII